MYGNYGGGWMGGGWMMLIWVLISNAIIGAVVWLVMRALRNKQATPLTSIPQQQQHPYQMNGQGYQTPPQQSTETYKDGEKQYSYPQSGQYPQQQQERPLD